MQMGPGEPHLATGTMVNAWDLKETVLRQDYTGDQSDGPFSNFLGRGYFGYNPATQQYEGFWIDSASSMMQLEYGGVDASGKSWEMLSEFLHPESKQVVKKRSVIAVQSDVSHSMDTYMTFPGQPEMKVMGIRFTRKS